VGMTLPESAGTITRAARQRRPHFGLIRMAHTMARPQNIDMIDIPLRPLDLRMSTE
jgi:hypothetical protein